MAEEMIEFAVSCVRLGREEGWRIECKADGYASFLIDDQVYPTKEAAEAAAMAWMLRNGGQRLAVH